MYDEASDDGTREIVRRVIAEAAPPDVDARLMTASDNSGPVLAWRVLLHEIAGDWCCFVWADDVLREDFSRRMMDGAARAVAAGRKVVACSADIEIGGELVDNVRARAEPAHCRKSTRPGIFFRRYPLTQICAVYEREAARAVFDRHIRFDNPLGFDYNREPYGNDVGFLSELAFAGGGVEQLGDALVRLTDSPMSMTRLATGSHLWQMRWQYTFNQTRVWRTWEEKGVPGAARLRRYRSTPPRALYDHAGARQGPIGSTQHRAVRSGVHRFSPLRLPEDGHEPRRIPQQADERDRAPMRTNRSKARPTSLITRTTCRICGSPHLAPVLSLGDHHIAGAFADPNGEAAIERRVPLELVRCDTEKDQEACGLLQTRHTVPGAILYRSYWYRSGINRTMTENLHGIAQRAEELADLDPGDLVIDIGCNDGTLLDGYSTGA